jgi:hypothetical protein
MAKQKGHLTTLWLNAKELISDYDFSEEKAQQLSTILEMGILCLAKATLEDQITDKELMEGVKKETWYERFWVAMEKYVWPTYPDYEENWKCS